MDEQNKNTIQQQVSPPSGIAAMFSNPPGASPIAETLPATAVSRPNS